MKIKNKLIWFTLSVILLDIIVTYQYWIYETNPIALSLGKFGFLGIKVILLPTLFWVYQINVYKNPKITKISLSFISALYTTVFITNIWVLIQ